MHLAPELTETNQAEQNLFSKITTLGHEQVLFCNDPELGLKAIIAVHNTSLGPSLGGTRFWNYATEQDAITDVLRLSRGMTYKSAVSGLNLGGGKAVIIGNPMELSNERFWRRFGQFVDSLNGKYITAEDVGTCPEYMDWVSQETAYVTGKPQHKGGSGDPSPVTAYGVYVGMKASAKVAWGTDSLQGKKVLVEGVGHVGEVLVEYLTQEQAEVYVCDINQDRALDIVNKYGAKGISTDAALDLDLDIYAPCALGATLNTSNINRLKAAIVAGAANNQLEDEVLHGNMLMEKGISYAPDFLINAGGIMNCYSELEGKGGAGAMDNANSIYDKTLEIFNRSISEGITTHQAAVNMADERLLAAKQVKPKL